MRVEVTESLTTTEDGDQTVNERLSPGGPGPEGQPDTATESISGEAAPVEDVPEPAEDSPAPRKAASKKKVT